MRFARTRSKEAETRHESESPFRTLQAVPASLVFAAVLVAAFAAVSSARAQDAGPDNAAAPEVGTWVPSTPQTFTYVVPYTTSTILVGPFVTSVSNGIVLIT